MSEYFGGFNKREQESRYNETIFELIHALATRFTASLNTSKLFCQQINIYRDAGDVCAVYK